MQKFKEAFEEYGADYNNTLERFMGNEAMYIKLLGMLFEDENLEKLGDSLKEGDFDSAFAAAHTLKGVSANLGLTPLCDAVCLIVEPLRRKDPRGDYEDLYERICKEFTGARKLWEKAKRGE